MRKIDQRPLPESQGLIRQIDLERNSRQYHDILSDYIEMGGIEIEIPYQYSYLLGLRNAEFVNVWFDHSSLYFSAVTPDRPVMKCPLFYKRYKAFPLGDVDPDYDDMFCVFPTALIPLATDTTLTFEYVRNDLSTIDRYLRANYEDNTAYRS